MADALQIADIDRRCCVGACEREVATTLPTHSANGLTWHMNFCAVHARGLKGKHVTVDSKGVFWTRRKTRG